MFKQIIVCIIIIILMIIVAMLTDKSEVKQPDKISIDEQGYMWKGNQFVTDKNGKHRKIGN